MEPINSDMLSMVHKDHGIPSISFHPSNRGMQNQKFVNDVAAFMPGLSTSGTQFDLLMNNIASFKDMISVAQGGISQMQREGESIRDLIAQAREEGVTPELLDKVQAEVEARLGAIKNIREGANFNGVNPFNGSFSLDIPNILELMNAQDKEEVNGEISEMLASVDIDFTLEGNGFSFGGSAKIEIGYTDDGALQINVDASMDFDLSGLLDKGVSSDEAWEMINQFLDMLGVQEGDLADAQNFMDAIFEKLFNLMTGNTNDFDGVDLEMSSSGELKGHIAQQASITLDGMAGQSPSIAINVL